MLQLLKSTRGRPWGSRPSSRSPWVSGRPTPSRSGPIGSAARIRASISSSTIASSIVIVSSMCISIVLLRDARPGAGLVQQAPSRLQHAVVDRSYYMLLYYIRLYTSTGKVTILWKIPRGLRDARSGAGPLQQARDAYANGYRRRCYY